MKEIIKNGNRNGRGKSIDMMYWNKGSMHLHRKLGDVETIVVDHHPHVFALGEANVHEGHDLEDISIPNYNLHLSRSINNPDMKVARVAVYTHKSLVVKRRNDLDYCYYYLFQSIYMEIKNNISV